MQKRYLLILLLLIAGFAAWFFLRPTGSGTSDKSKTEFAVENTGDISKVFISHKLYGNVLLEKKKGVWYVNGKYEASKPTMEFFLNETLKKVRVQGPVAQPARQGVIASMASLATKVEIYLNDDEPEKVYYVGNATGDMTGTYMYLEGSKDPYITHIPGFDGFLSTRYPVDENEWVSKVIFDYKPEDIKSVDVNYPGDVNASFTLTRKGNSNDIDVTTAQTAPSGNLNYAAVKSYFELFVNKTCEGYIKLKPAQADSIKKSIPVCIVTLIDKKNTTHRLKIYKRTSTDRDHGLYDNKGNRLAYDPSRFNATLDNDERIFVIQDLAFNPIMIKYSDFFIKQAGD